LPGAGHGRAVLLMDEPFARWIRSTEPACRISCWRCGIPAGLRAPSCSSPTTDEAILLADRVVVLGMSRANHRGPGCPIPRPRPRRQTYLRPEFQGLRKPSPTTCRATCCSGCRPRTRWRRPRDMSIGVKRPQVDHPLLWERAGVRYCIARRIVPRARLQHFGDFSVRLMEASPSPHPNPLPEGEG